MASRREKGPSGPATPVKATDGRQGSHYEFDPKAEQGKAEQDKAGGLWSFLSGRDWQRIVYLTAVALIVRFAFIDHPSVVIFDEVHFGGFAQKYLRREFFSDLHPPLARLLVTLSAWLGGFDGAFSFYDIGADYVKAGAPYVLMRSFSALCGAAVIPVAFVTMRAMGVTPYTATAVAAMLIIENALVTQSRLILLDAYLVLFTTLVGLFWMLLQRQSHR